MQRILDTTRNMRFYITYFGKITKFKLRGWQQIITSSLPVGVVAKSMFNSEDAFYFSGQNRSSYRDLSENLTLRYTLIMLCVALCGCVSWSLVITGVVWGRFENKNVSRIWGFQEKCLNNLYLSIIMAMNKLWRLKYYACFFSMLSRKSESSIEKKVDHISGYQHG